ncbi:hypothetical protein QYM36_015428, partial [Artemia franciscana]
MLKFLPIKWTKFVFFHLTGAWWARDISSSYSDFFHRAKTKEDGTYSTNDNLWPFGVLNTEGYKSKYFFGDLTTRYTDFPTITLSSVKFELYTP